MLFTLLRYRGDNTKAEVDQKKKILVRNCRRQINNVRFIILYYIYEYVVVQQASNVYFFFPNWYLKHNEHYIYYVRPNG